MLGFSQKTEQWILGFFSFNVLVSVYIYTFFYHEWIRTLSSVFLPLLIWEVLVFGILAPDDVFSEIFGDNNSSMENALRSENLAHSIRPVIVSSGDH